MRHITRLALAASALTMISVSVAAAADLGPVVIQPEAVPEPPVLMGGWYLRGDISYEFKTKARVHITTTSSFSTFSSSSTFFDADFDDTWNIGAGLGYIFNDWFRADITADYRFPADWNGPAATSVSVSTILLNGYASLGNFSGISPYVGAGVGFAYVEWDTLSFPAFFLPDAATVDNWRIAYALMAGISFEVTDNLAIDTGYRFTGVNDGQLVAPFGPFFGGADYTDLYIHEFRIGMRYRFGNFGGGY